MSASDALNYFLGSDIVSMNHLWTTASPILGVNPPYNITTAYTHQGTLGQFPGGLSATGVILQFSGQHGAPTIDAIGHIGVNGTVFGGLTYEEVQSDQGLLKMGIEEYPVDKYLNRGVLLDMPYCMDVDILPENTILTLADMNACLAKEKVEIAKGDSVLIRTGYGSLFESDSVAYTTNYPGPSDEVANYLADQEIFLTGVDNLSWDAANTPFPGHVILIPLHGIYIVENINLELVAQACQDHGTWEFVMVMNPPQIKGAAAGAANAFAIFPPDMPTVSPTVCDAAEIVQTKLGLVLLAVTTVATFLVWT